MMACAIGPHSFKVAPLHIISIFIFINSVKAWTQFNSSAHSQQSYARRPIPVKMASPHSSNTPSPSSSEDSWRTQSPYNSAFGQQQQQKKEGAEVDESTDSATIVNYYNASCYCGRVQYQVRGEPESAKFCHCRGCQQLHGAPFEWVSFKFTTESWCLLSFLSSCCFFRTPNFAQSFSSQLLPHIFDRFFFALPEIGMYIS